MLSSRGPRPGAPVVVEKELPWKRAIFRGVGPAHPSPSHIRLLSLYLSVPTYLPSLPYLLNQPN
jgi:hypothetical protein